MIRVLGASSTPIASCATWTRDLPSIGGKRLGFMGRFECAGGGPAAALLEATSSWLAREGCQLAVGPLDGSTWHRYRFVTDSTSEPPFAMEPTNPPEWPEYWKDAGFAPLATYHSSLNDEIKPRDPLCDEASSRARAAGLSLRTLNMGEFERELRSIFELSMDAFADNFLYSPIAWDEFAGMYARLKDILDPRLVLLSDDPARPGALAGFIMAIPDQFERGRSGACRTVILKSVAVSQRWRSVGLGTWLIAQAQQDARALGLSRSIFALMHDSNRSARVSGHYARVIRQYALFARELAG